MADAVNPNVAHGEVMAKLARGVDHVLNEGKVDTQRTGFFLASFKFNMNEQEHRVDYISNAQKPYVKTMLKVLLDQLEADPEAANDAGNKSQGAD